MNQQSTLHESLVTDLAALPSAQVRQTDYAAKGYDLDVSLPPESLVPAVNVMDAAGYFLESITGVDWLGEQAALRKAAEAEEAAATKARAEALAKQAEEEAKATNSQAAPATESGAEPAAEPAAKSGAEPGSSSAANAAASTAASTAATPAAQPPPPAVAPLPEDEIEVVYDFNRFESRHRVVLRVRTPRSQPQVPTILNIYPIAHWHEREAHDFFGIVFTGHPYLVPLLLPKDADFHPLLKDYGA